MTAESIKEMTGYTLLLDPLIYLLNYIKKYIAKEGMELILSRIVTARIILVQYWKSQKCPSKTEWLTKL